MLNKSIAYRLSIFISLAVISVFIAFIGIFILFQKKLLQENVQQSAISHSTEISSIVGRYVVSTKEVTANIAKQIVFYGQHNHPEIFLTELVKKYPFINAIHVHVDSAVNDVSFNNYFCFLDNDSVYFIQDRQRIITCTTDEKFIKKLSASKIPAWSDPIKCMRNDKLVVSYYVPIVYKGQIAGGVICELSLLELNRQINNLANENNALAVLLSQDGVFLTHPNKDWIANRNVFNIPDKIYDKNKLNLKSILEDRLEGSTTAYPEYLDYKKAWLYYRPIKDIDWTLIFALPYNELYEPMYLPILQMLFFSVLGILIIYLLITYISNKQIEPLNTLTHQLKVFSSLAGDESSGLSDNEIKRIEESLNYIKLWYEKYKINLSEEKVKNKKRARDIDLASEIQQSFIKMNFPAFPDRDDIDLYASYQPAKGVSGDLFDYFFIDDYHLVFTIGDVSGKGVPAAFFMSVAQTIIKSHSHHFSAKTIVEETSKELYTSNKHQFFLTLFLGILNVKTGEIDYCNAAHTAGYIIKKNGKLIKLSDSHGLPLGLYPDKSYGESSVHIEAEDSIVVYTDGVTELQDKNSKQYGPHQLEENLQTLAGLNPKEMVEKIDKSLKVFIGEAKQSDDISILILKYKP